MIDSIQEIRKALDKDCYLAALALSLTLPDICSQVENAVMDGNRTLYINWFNSHELKVLVDSFELLKPDDQDYKPGYTYIKKTQPDGTVKVITCIAIDYLCERLCNMAEQFYNGWANKQDFDAHKIWSK